jgi:hypothetical protein
MRHGGVDQRSSGRGIAAIFSGAAALAIIDAGDVATIGEKALTDDPDVAIETCTPCRS